MEANSAVKDFVCPICMEIYEDPVRLPCKHVFCRECVIKTMDEKNPSLCVVCSAQFKLCELTDDLDVQGDIGVMVGSCLGCRHQMTPSDLRKHNSTCPELLKAAKEVRFKPIAESTQPIPSNVPNRSTFQCPMCAEKNLDCRSLLDHCNSKHRHSDQHVVCPVCASMPWGDPNKKSSDFLQHLNIRHKFEYDT